MAAQRGGPGQDGRPASPEDPRRQGRAGRHRAPTWLRRPYGVMAGASPWDSIQIFRIVLSVPSSFRTASP